MLGTTGTMAMWVAGVRLKRTKNHGCQKTIYTLGNVWEDLSLEVIAVDLGGGSVETEGDSADPG